MAFKFMHSSFLFLLLCLAFHGLANGAYTVWQLWSFQNHVTFYEYFSPIGPQLTLAPCQPGLMMSNLAFSPIGASIRCRRSARNGWIFLKGGKSKHNLFYTVLVDLATWTQSGLHQIHAIPLSEWHNLCGFWQNGDFSFHNSRRFH
jgi:hypothetical protein